MDVKKQVDKLTNLFKHDKFRVAIIALGLLGIVLIYLSTLFTPAKKKQSSKTADTQIVTAEEYERKWEEKLSQIVSAITGEKSPTVMVTLETLGEAVYAKDSTQSLDDTEEYKDGQKTQATKKEERESAYVIIKDGQGNQQAIKISETQPQIKGVVVVSRHADDVFIQAKLIGAVKTAMNLSSSKICVVSANESTEGYP